MSKGRRCHQTDPSLIAGRTNLPASEWVRIGLPIYCLMLGTIYLLREVIVDEFVCVHVAFSYPSIRFWSIAFPLDEVVCSPMPWFSSFSPDFAFSTIENFLDFILFLSVD